MYNIIFNQDGFTALKWAAQYGFSEILKYLIQAGANVNENDTVSTLNSIAVHVVSIIIHCVCVCNSVGQHLCQLLGMELPKLLVSSLTMEQLWTYRIMK